MNKNEKVNVELTRAQCAALYCLAGKVTGTILGDLWYKLRPLVGDTNRAKYDDVAYHKSNDEIVKFHQYENEIIKVFFPYYQEDNSKRLQKIKELEASILEANRQLQELKQL